MEPGDSTAGMAVPVVMLAGAGGGLAGMAVGVETGREGRGLLSDRSTGSVWSASAGCVSMTPRGGGEDFSLRSVGSVPSSTGSSF